MMKLDNILLRKAIEEKHVSVQKHPDADLFIYNYTPVVQYDKLWNEVTLNTRGLIMDGKMNVISKPFGKFFNLEEHSPTEIPNLPFEVFDKLDGSLGVLYWIGGIPKIATRGSFTSTQAIHATEILYGRYAHVFEQLNQGKTYLFEIIYPENRIVVDYKGIDDIFLLTVIDNETGEESLDDIGFPLVKRFDGINDLLELKALENNDQEGFVIRFSNGFRVKMKFAEYVRLHRIITGISSLSIWQYLSQGLPFNELLERVPDEFYNWVNKVQYELRGAYVDIEEECLGAYKEFGTRKESAIYFQTQKYPAILFNMLDGKSYQNNIWKLIRPAHTKPFKIEE